MSSYEKQIKEIEQNKKKIALAISKAYVDCLDEKEENVNTFYSKFYEKIKDCRVFFVEVNKVQSKYDQDFSDLLNRLENIITEWLNVETEEENAQLPEGEYSYLSDTETGFSLIGYDKMYYNNVINYMSVGLDKETFVTVCVNSKGKAVEEINSLINEIMKKSNHKEIKSKVSLINSLHKCNLTSKKFIKFYDKYHLKNMDDLMNLLTEVNSFVVDVNKVEKDMVPVIEKNRNNFRKRINKKEDYVLSKKDALKLKKQIEQMYEDNFFDEIFVKSNIGDFFEKYGIEYTLNNMRYIVNVYLEMDGTSGVRFSKDFGDGENQYALFNSVILDQSEYGRLDTYLHEFEHCVQPEVSVSSFKDRYSALYEVLTDYITKYAYLHYIGKNKDEYSFDRESSEEGSSYNYALGVISRLRESSIWKDVVLAKMNNNAAQLERILGRYRLEIICQNIEAIINSGEDSIYPVMIKVNNNLDEMLNDVEEELLEKRNRQS